MLKLGSQGISGLRLGETEIRKAYLGDALVFNMTDVPTPPDPLEPATYTITASIDPTGSGTVSGTGTYQEGETVTLKATAGDGYTFTEWRENGSVVHSSEEYSFTASRDVSLTAAFAVKPSSRLPEGYTELQYVRSLTTSIYNNRYQPCTAIGNLRADSILSISAYPENFPTRSFTLNASNANSSIRTR